jgi:uncharacterized damage-inducible protein DinB
MTVTADTLRTHLDYSAWASRQLVDAAAQLSEEELMRDFGTADHNVLGTLAHVYAADRVWLHRVLGNAPGTFLDPEKDLRMEVLQQDWPAIYDGWQRWAAQLDDSSTGRRVAYKDLKGNPYQTPIWQIVLHVVNHGTHHRGQAAGFLRSMGRTPPRLDLIAYYRGQS